MTFVDVELVEGLALPYVAGAETALAEFDLDPSLALAWAGLVAAFPSATLQPLFDGLPVDVLGDMVDVVRTSGDEPPNPFAWFSVPCTDDEADALVVALQALPLVGFAGRRSATALASVVSYGTNPLADGTLQIQEAPNGVSAIYGWDVPGGSGRQVRIADTESGWLLNHQELLTADIRRTPAFGSPTQDDIDHGTAVAGVLVGADNGVGTVGITPDASLTLVTFDRGAGDNVPAAITVAANAVGTGGIVLIEGAGSFRTPDPGADVPVELDRAVQVATRLATLFGVTVIEPAGNTAIDLDTFAELAHFRPGSPTFVDSHTIVVGAGELDAVPPNAWIRTFSSFGSRVDCFGPGKGVRAPAASAPDAYQGFTGTSSASAVIAGTAAALQGMTIAATGQLLAPTDIRRLFRDPALTTPTGSPATDRIGAMPDLHKIANALGFLRVLPVGLAATPGDGAVLVHLDDQNRLVRRHWTLFTSWGAPLPAPDFFLTAGQPSVLSFEEPTRLVHSAFVLGGDGLHHLEWDSLGATGDISVAVAPGSALSQGSSVASVRALPDVVVVAGISPAGQLVVMTRDPLTAPLVVDGAAQFRRTDGVAMVSRGPALVDLVAVEDGGALRWYTGDVVATIGTGFSPGVSEPSFTSFDPSARPALLAEDDGTLLAAGVSLTGALDTVRIDPVAAVVDAAVEVDPDTHLAAGPLALVRTAVNVVALAIDREGALRFATRPRGGGDFTSFGTVLTDLPLNAVAGVSAVALDTLGVLAVVTGTDGRLRFALSPDGTLWPALLPIF